MPLARKKLLYLYIYLVGIQILNLTKTFMLIISLNVQAVKALARLCMYLSVTFHTNCIDAH